MHTDWWRCDRCQIKRVQITDDFDYELSCPICGKAMKLVSRTPDEEMRRKVPPPGLSSPIIRTPNPLPPPRDVREQ